MSWSGDFKKKHQVYRSFLIKESSLTQLEKAVPTIHRSSKLASVVEEIQIFFFLSSYLRGSEQVHHNLRLSGSLCFNIVHKICVVIAFFYQFLHGDE